MKKLNKKGFTLIELIVVIAILAILAAILIPAITGYITKATNGKDQANCRSIYAETAMGIMLESITANGSDAQGGVTGTWTGDYTNRVILTFTCVGTNQTFSAPGFVGVPN